MAPKGDNVLVSSKKLEKIFCMKGGKGESSYANNSKAQAMHARSMLHLLKETLDRVQLSSSEVPFVVADLGCSSGSNTINTVDVIIRHMAKRYEASGYDLPEFSAFFSLISLAMTSTPSSNSSLLWPTTAVAWRRPSPPTATAPTL
ncbi:indole-3-acetate O-methyltransferase 1 isoform X1 [Prunus yedoensis var. nudiflora]|uniref:Indole-3-acetate O-methyltransferase 1 isoform X1 n=1 Tax=Prunus yedoensis var. nudiflora TaxID=2094558 RepID=A0A314YWG5_PRUYE|nr:indole-3-acetate O-methyltransferase 1 isoform X1 [Prunus yedoensis var. nudiflora]